MNSNLQQLLSVDYELEWLNTSGHNEREDLYGAKGFAEVKRLLKTWLACFRFLRACHAPIVNVFVTSNISFLRDAVIIVLARMHGKKVLVHLHSKKHGELFLGRWTIRILGGVLRLAECVFVLSRDHRAFFAKYIPTNRLEVLENFVFVDDFKPKQARTSFEMMYIGRLTPQKGFYDLLLAVESLAKKGYEFVINVAGAAETEEEDKKISELVKSKGLAANFVFHGLVSGERKLAIFHRSVIMLFPSRFENSPVVLKEAIAAKQFVLCSDIPANKNTMAGRIAIEDGVLEFKCANVQDLTKKMRYLLDNRETIIDAAAIIRCSEEMTDTFAKEKITSVFSRFTSEPGRLESS